MMNKSMLALIRLFFASVSRIAPKLAGRMAFRLFCTTFKVGTRAASHQAILTSAAPLFADSTRHTIAYSGGTIAAFEFSPTNSAKPAHSLPGATEESGSGTQTILLVHGWQSHSAFMYKFIEPLQRQGFRVVAIDLPGHGQSSGRLFHLPLAVEAIHATREKLGVFHQTISHSLGGAAVATALAGTLPEYSATAVSAAVLISSPNSMSRIFNEFSNMVGLNKAANAALHDNVRRLSGRVTEDFDVASQLQSVNTSILLMHAPDDKEVPYSEATSIVQVNQSATLMPMSGLGHRRIIGDDKVVDTAVKFVCSNRF